MRAAAKPLAGRRIVITRARAQAGALARRIEALGAEVVEFPTIEIQAPESFAPLDRALNEIEKFSWLIFTSVNGVEPFLARLQAAGKSAGALKHLRVGAIGPQTAKRLAAAGIACSMVPERYQAEGILESLTPQEMSGKRVLIPRAAEAREVLPDTLRTWGAAVEVVPAYRTMIPATDIAPLERLLAERKIAALTFTSSSTVRNFVQLFGGKKISQIVGASAIACIGPITAQTVEELGGHVDILATEFTVEGLVRAMVDHFTTGPGGGAAAIDR